MSDMGMQLPGGAMRRGPVMNVYTGLLLAAVVALAAGCGFVWFQGGKVAPDGTPLSIHDRSTAKWQSSLKLAGDAK